jgi:hypothetical protein
VSGYLAQTLDEQARFFDSLSERAEQFIREFLEKSDELAQDCYLAHQTAQLLSVHSASQEAANVQPAGLCAIPGDPKA